MSNDVVNGQTRIAAIIGNPVAQSLSPVIHNAVFRSLGVNWVSDNRRYSRLCVDNFITHGKNPPALAASTFFSWSSTVAAKV